MFFYSLLHNAQRELESSPHCLPLKHFGEIDAKLNVPKLLIDILVQLVLKTKECLAKIVEWLREPIAKNAMIEVLDGTKPADYQPKEVIMAFLWYFRSASACNGIDTFWIRLNESLSIISRMIICL